jgi:hypothetical protein
MKRLSSISPSASCFFRDKAGAQQQVAAMLEALAIQFSPINPFEANPCSSFSSSFPSPTTKQSLKGS